MSPKFCIDCRHRVPHQVEANLSKCDRYEKQEGNNAYLVTGEGPSIALFFCSTARLDKSLCGPDAKGFEPVRVAA